MKKVLTLIIGLVFSFTGFSQPCFPSGIGFNSQTQIDSFQITFPNCTEIIGHLIIGSNDITNLNGLSAITSVGDDLWINYCPALDSITNLNNLISVGGRLEICENSGLKKISGFSNLTSIGSHFQFCYNDSLIIVEGFDNLTYIGGNLEFNGAWALISLPHWENLISIGGGLGILNTGTLTSLTGLENISSIGGDLGIWSNYSLNSLDGLENIASVGGFLWIFYNYSLSSISGIANIAAGSITDLRISDNINLSACDVQSICDYLASPSGEVFIDKNATGCMSPEEVEAACFIGGYETTPPEPQITFSPNPASTAITISLPSSTPIKNTTITIFNVNSQQVISHQITEPQTVIDINTLPGGIYFALIPSDKTVMVGKFVKK